MTKYHTNKLTGVTSVCSAQIKCRLGSDDEHYPTEAAARTAYEKTMAKSLIEITPNKKKSIATIKSIGYVGENLEKVLKSSRLSSNENKTLALYAQLNQDMLHRGKPSEETIGRISGLHFAKEALSAKERLLLSDMEAIAKNEVKARTTGDS